MDMVSAIRLAESVFVIEDICLLLVKNIPARITALIMGSVTIFNANVTMGGVGLIVVLRNAPNCALMMGIVI